jgi:hypothetical protein
VLIYVQKLFSFSINAIEICIDKVLSSSQARRIMRTTNHPTSWLLYKIASVYIASRFGHSLADAKLQDIAKIHTTSSLYPHHLTGEFAIILDQQSVIYRLIRGHRDTPYLNLELELKRLGQPRLEAELTHLLATGFRLHHGGEHPADSIKDVGVSCGI